MRDLQSKENKSSHCSSATILNSKQDSAIKEYERKLASDESDDPLSVWICYLNYLENCEDSAYNFLLVLKRCITEYKFSDQYRNDIRFIKLWFRYAEVSGDIPSIYEEILQLKIASKLAFFYEHFGALFEKTGLLQKAEQCFLIGIERQAKPLDRLKKHFFEFEKRHKQTMRRPLSVLKDSSLKEEKVQDNGGPVKESCKERKETLSLLQTRALPTGGVERVRYAVHLLSPKGDIELSPEELRALQPKYSYLIIRESTEILKEDLISAEARVTLPESPTSDHKSLEVDGFKDFTATFKAEILSRSSRNSEVLEPPSTSSPTVHTQKAISDVMAMFNAPLPFEHVHEAVPVVTPDAVSVLFSKGCSAFPVPQDMNRTKDPLAPFEDSHPKQKLTNADILKAMEEKPPVSHETVPFTIYVDGEKELCLEDTPDETPLPSTLLPLSVRTDQDNKTEPQAFNTTQTPAAALVSLNGRSKLSPIPETSPEEVKHVAPAPSDIEGLCPALKAAKSAALTHPNYYSSDSWLPTICAGSQLELGTGLYDVQEEFGDGKRIYMVVHMAVYDSLLITDEVDISDDHDVLTMKIAPHSDVWEFYIACEFQRRIRNLREPATLNVHQSRVAAAHSVTVFKDASVTLLKYLPHQDSLLDVLLAYQCENKFMDESLVIFYAIELLGILEDLRDCNIFHGAVCPENLLLRSGKAPTGKWFKDGSNGWRDHGLVIINFEKSSDLQLGSSATSLEKCEKALAEPQLQNNDSLGLLSVLYYLLYMKPFEIPSGNENFIAPLENSRKLHFDLWSKLFEEILQDPNSPDGRTFHKHKVFLESFLEADEELNSLLRSSLRKQTIMAYNC